MRSTHLVMIGVLALSGCGDDGGTADTGALTMGTGGDDSSASATASTGATTSVTESGTGTDSGSEGTADDSATGGTEGTTGVGTTGGLEGTWVTLETSMGDIVLELDPDLAPITTANFLTYVDAGFFDGEDGMGQTVFHRVISGFMIQGGGLTETLQQKTTMAAIVNESGNGLTNVRGSIAMARTNDPDSATSQFFINHVDNPNLDTPPGYAVFGQVSQGLDVVDAIAAVSTTTMSPYDDVPVTAILITDAYQGVP